MAWPDGVPTRLVTAGRGLSIERGRGLGVSLTVASSRPLLIWAATGDRFGTDPASTHAGPGGPVELYLPCTDTPGWLDEHGREIDVSEPDTFTHRYTADLWLTDGNRRELTGTRRRVEFILPAGDGPLDLDSGIEAGTVEGEPIVIPPEWGTVVEEARASADAAAASAVDAKNEADRAQAIADAPDSVWGAVDQAEAAQDAAETARDAASGHASDAEDAAGTAAGHATRASSEADRAEAAAGTAAADATTALTQAVQGEADRAEREADRSETEADRAEAAADAAQQGATWDTLPGKPTYVAAGASATAARSAIGAGTSSATAMSEAEARAGTGQTSRTISAARLKDAIETHAPVPQATDEADLSSLYVDGVTGTFFARTWGPVVELYGTVAGQFPSSNLAHALAAGLPEDLRPPGAAFRWGTATVGQYAGVVRVSPDGTIAVGNRSGADWNNNFYWSIVYLSG
ncbi:hypothetical protein [Microbacterium sp. gxy059]|uniref:hypothetical protein n=1 Tax=Microbacterium sp. gxy059 TaxID=2957199 RepID=UPI003D95A1CF